MQSCIAARETGDISPSVYARTISTRLLRSFAAVPQHLFDGDGGRAGGVRALPGGVGRPGAAVAHASGVATLAIDKFDGRLLLSGGSDGTVRLWNLEAHAATAAPHAPHTFIPVATVSRISAPSLLPAGLSAGLSASSAGSSSFRPSAQPYSAVPRTGHSRGVTHLEFYPFDADAFLSSSHDQTVQLWATSRMQPASTFDLGCAVYSHAASPIAQHLLVACATQNPAVRLVDLRSGAAIQALADGGGARGGGGGPVLAAAWSPRFEHLLASGHSDGTLRIWDVRRANALIGMLDREDSLGISHRMKHAVASSSTSSFRPFRRSAVAHTDAVNSVAWTDDGQYLVSAGLDEQIRVWDGCEGANTLVSFGPAVRNSQVATRPMIVTPAALTVGCREMVFWPNASEILVLDLHEGTVLSRLRTSSHPGGVTTGGRGGAAHAPPRINAIAWRGAGAHGCQGTTRMGGMNAPGGIYAAHADGCIRAWMPRLSEAAQGDQESDGDGDGDEDGDGRGGGRDGDGGDGDEDADRRKKKRRKVLGDAYRGLMGQGITFT